ncbi:uncharacterized protein LOC127854445 [Dreissena polymorpha]|uniref:Uncharacterized protein n=1 Tax=Dreissena polymorpha TaxID=45954 RepID=A0A9D4C3V9_DREPO|nr:uncharacterized protein LOC127854445 [Dreissena polymorpha]KAH3716647.1 hypothetical protein DPMN_059373 [Dreissena polymorpha]
MDILSFLSTLWICGVLIPVVKGKIMCACTTLDCYAEKRRVCEAEYFCYVENLHAVVTRGCINDKDPLLCENRRPTKIGKLDYPLLHCCNDDDYCNRDVVPVRPTDDPPITPVVHVTSSKDDDANNPYVRYEYEDSEKAKTPCPSSSDSKMNPIYIAVPIAGLCVLLALIIFAMYLLRRRNDMYTQYDAFRYQEHLAKMAAKQNAGKNTQSCEVSNRCTDSERSSQGSETKFFLNA